MIVAHRLAFVFLAISPLSFVYGQMGTNVLDEHYPSGIGAMRVSNKAFWWLTDQPGILGFPAIAARDRDFRARFQHQEAAPIDALFVDNTGLCHPP